jgi:single-stranded DNA-binding protein
MSFVNDVRIIGEIIEDANVNKSKGVATLKVKTGRPIKGSNNKTEWQFQTHSVKCYKDSAFNMLQTKAKKGKWIKVLGELTYNNGQVEILVRKTTGDIGMMFSHLGIDDNQDKNESENNSDKLQSEPEFKSPTNSFLGGTSSKDDDDDIPF